MAAVIAMRTASVCSGLNAPWTDRQVAPQPVANLLGHQIPVAAAHEA